MSKYQIRDQIRRWITAPDLKDAKKNHVAGMLYIVALTLLAVLFLTSISSLLLNLVGTAITLAVGMVGPLVALLLARRGYLNAAGFSGLSIFLIALTCQLYRLDGIHDVAVIAYPALIVVAGLLLDKRFFKLYVILTMLALLGIIVGELTGLVVSRMSGFTNFSDAIYAFLILLLTAVGARFLSDLISRNIIQVYSAQRNLRTTNQELRREIAERTRAESEVHRRTEGLLAVNALAVRCASAPVDEDLWVLLAEELKTITGALAVGISSYDPVAGELAIRHIAVQGAFLSQATELFGKDLSSLRIPLQPHMVKEMLSKVVTIEDSLTEISFGAIPRPVAVAISQLLSIDSPVGMVFHHGGELVGSSTIIMRKGEPALLIDVIRTFASVAAVSLRRQKAQETLQRRNDELELLNKAGRGFNSTLDLDLVLITVLEEARQMLDVTACSVWFIERETGTLICRQAASPKSEIIQDSRLAMGQGIVGWSVQQNQSAVVPNAQIDPRYDRSIDERTGLWLSSVLAVPLRAKGQVIGALEVVDRQSNRFTQDDRVLVESLALTAATAIENARLYEQTNQDAEIKATLLDEVNHRVKNNLISIMGLINLEKQRHLDNSVDLDAVLDGTQNRIRGLITIHELLSAAQWAPLPLEQLIQQVIQSALYASPISHKIKVAIATEIENSAAIQMPIMVTPRQATGLTMIFNELTTNSIKHAFADRDRGHIDVCIAASVDGTDVSIQFHDDGSGYPDRVLNENHQNVGLNILRGTVRSTLNGHLVLSNDHGALTTIAFQPVSKE